MVRYILKNLDDFRDDLFISMNLTESRLRDLLPQLYSSEPPKESDSSDSDTTDSDSDEEKKVTRKLDLYNDSDWPKCKKIIKKVLRKEDPKKIIDYLDGQSDDCAHTPYIVIGRIKPHTIIDAN